MDDGRDRPVSDALTPALVLKLPNNSSEGQSKRACDMGMMQPSELLTRTDGNGGTVLGKLEYRSRYARASHVTKAYPWMEAVCHTGYVLVRSLTHRRRLSTIRYTTWDGLIPRKTQPPKHFRLLE